MRGRLDVEDKKKELIHRPNFDSVIISPIQFLNTFALSKQLLNVKNKKTGYEFNLGQ